MMVVGLVFHFTSDKPLAQADDAVSQRNAKAALTSRSLNKQQRNSIKIKLNFGALLETLQVE